jgi:hypothetical protein
VREPLPHAEALPLRLPEPLALAQGVLFGEGVALRRVLPVAELAIYVDPLDATREFSEGLTQYVSVSACITRCGRPLATARYWRALSCRRQRGGRAQGDRGHSGRGAEVGSSYADDLAVRRAVGVSVSFHRCGSGRPARPPDLPC